MSEELKPCPYCASDTCECFPVKDSMFQVACSECFMRGPRYVSQDEAITAWNSLPRRLRWTKEKPTKPDYYWNKDVKILRIGEIMELSGSLFCHFAGENEPQLLDLIDGEWAGPIPEPEDA